MDCVICKGPEGDPELMRTQIWEDHLWRLTMSLGAEILGFCYLEPKRHIPHVTDLDGEEAGTFGEVLGRVTKALAEEAGTELVYVYVFGGGVPHLHLHLAPHREGDALNDQMIRGEVEEQRLPSGATAYASKEFPALPEQEHRALARRVAERLSSAG